MIHKIFGFKENSKEYLTRTGAYLIAIQNGCIAAVQTPKGYFLPGGKIEGTESHTQCIQRECLEKTGFSVLVFDYLCSAESYSVHPKIGFFHPVQHYYTGKLIRKIQQPLESDHQLVWLSIDHISQKFAVEPQQWAVEQFLSK